MIFNPIVLLKKNKLKSKFLNLSFIKICGFNNFIDIRNKFFLNKISIYGNNNTIEFSGDNCYKNKITIIGNNNRLSVYNTRGIAKSAVTIKGDNCTISCGDFTAIGGARIVSGGNGNIINIGEHCMISDKVEIWSTDTHRIFDKDGNHINPDKNITIGNHVWIGTGVSILKGCTVSDGAIIGMNSLVTSDCDGFSIYAGNPIRKVRSNVSWEI